jgi:hypothetical protein
VSKVRAITYRNSNTTLPFALKAVANLHSFKSLEKQSHLWLFFIGFVAVSSDRRENLDFYISVLDIFFATHNLLQVLMIVSSDMFLHSDLYNVRQPGM